MVPKTLYETNHDDLLVKLRKLEVLGRESLAENGGSPERLRNTLQTVVDSLQALSQREIGAVSYASQAAAAAPISVLVADDYLALRESISEHIDAQPDMMVVYAAGSCPEAIEAIRKTQPRVVLLSMGMPGGSDLHVMRAVKAVSPETRFVVLTADPDCKLFEACFAEGAAGFLTKSATTGEILSAVRQVAAGGQFISASLGRQTADSPQMRLARTLSQRELTVLQYVAQSYTSKEIAAELGLKPATVDTYRNRLAKKLGTRNRPELVRLALAARLIR